MGKIAVMMSAGRSDARMSSHFGKAEWIMISEQDGAAPEFLRNEGHNGRSVAELLIHRGCTDAIVVDIGDGALQHLQAAKIRAWAAPGAIVGHEALGMFAGGGLSPIPAASPAPGRGEGHGCCCAGHGAAPSSTRCCG